MNSVLFSDELSAVRPMITEPIPTKGISYKNPIRESLFEI